MKLINNNLFTNLFCFSLFLANKLVFSNPLELSDDEQFSNGSGDGGDDSFNPDKGTDPIVVPDGRDDDNNNNSGNSTGTEDNNNTLIIVGGIVLVIAGVVGAVC